MTVFVTGGSGLIGSFLIPVLLEKGYTVKASYRAVIPQFPGADQVQWLEGDILDPLFLREALEGVKYVFNSAGLVSYAPQDKELLKQVNIEGTANVVNACLEHGQVKLCHVSSIAAVGRPKGATILTEKDKFDIAEEHSAYASSKYFGELEVWRGISEGLKAVIVNPSVVLGPSDWHRSSTQLFKYVYKEKPFYTQGGANFVDVRDVVEAMLQLTFSDISGERFILNAEQLSYKDFFTAVAKCFGKKAPGVKVPPFLTEIVWRVEHMRSWLTGGRPLITKDTARITGKQFFFSNEKVLKATTIQFRPVKHSLEWVCRELKPAAQNSM
ncbi:NAD-dependent epimerase/dehydratase family protein [Pontibacter sp. H249]|uniref:NAD-dependent epimerase/dehydratase family protein n=1 Tax=Pontibacter sp. H249 TaxID=3133420 RepID=UPI0030C1FFE1